MLKSKEVKLAMATIGFVLLFFAFTECSALIGLIAILLICFGIPSAKKFAIKLMTGVLRALKSAVYEVSHAAAKGVADGKKKKRDDR